MAKKTAVIVGTNYPGTGHELSGCANDAADWDALLAAEGYAERTVLVDGAATRVAVLASLASAVSRMRWSDRLVFTFSGHGTWVPDDDGDEADGRDEAICPTDFMSSGVITDDSIQSVLAGVPAGAAALVLSDSCHSGTVSRVFAEAPPAGRPKFVPPTAFLPITESRATALEAAAASEPRRTASLISGCGDLEYSYDAWFGSRANGAFTRAAVEAHRGGITLSAWHRAIRGRLPSADFPQTPGLTASSLYRKYTRAL